MNLQADSSVDPASGAAAMRPDMSLLLVLEHHASRNPNKPLAVFGDDVVTYQGMLDWSAALAAGFRARGVGQGDVVGLLSYNSIEFLATIFAVNYLGAIAMPVNWRLAAAGAAVHPGTLPGPGTRVRRSTHRSRQRVDQRAERRTRSSVHVGHEHRRLGAILGSRCRTRRPSRECRCRVTTSIG